VNLLRYLVASSVLGAMLFGCASPHGQPRKDSEILAPNEIFGFGTLYAENCAGCHGAEGRGGAAIALADPVYLAVADDVAIRKVIASGVRGTAMPAFAQSSGGMLTDKQIDVIAREIRSALEPSRNSRCGESTRLRSKISGQHPSRRTRVQDLLRILSRSRAATEPQGEAPSRMIHFLRWSAIRGCAPLSSPAVPIWERRTGAETYPASRCRIRTSPT